MKWVWKFHRWYDSLQESWRLLILLVLALPIVTATLWVHTYERAVLWSVYLAILLGSRVYYVEFVKHVPAHPRIIQRREAIKARLEATRSKNGHKR